MSRSVVAALSLVACTLAGAALVSAQSPETAAAPSPAASEPWPGPRATVETAKGRFVIQLLPKVAPRHVEHFVKTARAGGFDGTTFHRIIAGGIIQGGDPLSKDPKMASRYGQGGLGLLKAEFSERPFARGAVAAARKPGATPAARNSGGSQFFVCVNEQAALKGQYTIFGEVVSGMDVVDQLSLTPVDGDKPKERVEIQKVTVEETPAVP